MDKEAKKKEKYLQELLRIEGMYKYERACYDQGYTAICGIDEVGRGPLAGPVVTCAIILKKDAIIIGVNDSKKISENKRKRIYGDILENAVDFAIGIVDEREIDEINILNATHKAMKQAVDKLKTKPDFILVDGLFVSCLGDNQRPITGGDGKSVVIAAASIIAKVTRDDMMIEYDKIYPEYGFASNKGYGTKMHIEKIKEYGLTPIHRRSFVKNLYKLS